MGKRRKNRKQELLHELGRPSRSNLVPILRNEPGKIEESRRALTVGAALGRQPVQVTKEVLRLERWRRAPGDDGWHLACIPHGVRCAVRNGQDVANMQL